MKLLIEESEYVFCDVQDIVRYLRKRNPAAAIRFVESFKRSVELLSGMPLLGRSRPELGSPEIRSWKVTTFRNFLIFCEVLPDRMRVLHGNRDLQQAFES